MTASDKILQKALVGSSINSAEWTKIQAAIRDRAFFSATVTDLRILDAFRSNVAQLVSAQKSPSEIRRDLRDYLAKIGYDPGSNRGTIRDLTTQRRLDVMMKTNADQARGYVSHIRATTAGAILAFPAYELIRVEQRMLPRDWHTRWNSAAARVAYEGVARSNRMIALKTSPIWVAISAFGNPFPPFDFNSGMGVRDISKSTCRELGLLAPGEQPAVPPLPDFNANLSAAIPFRNDGEYQFMKKSFGDQVQIDRKSGLVKWRGDLFRENFEKGGDFTIRLGEASSTLLAKLPGSVPAESCAGKPLTVTQHWLDRKRPDGSDHRSHFQPSSDHPEDLPLTYGDVDLLPSLWRTPDRVSESHGRLVLELDEITGDTLHGVVDISGTPNLKTLYKLKSRR